MGQTGDKVQFSIALFLFYNYKYEVLYLGNKGIVAHEMAYIISWYSFQCIGERIGQNRHDAATQIPHFQ